MNRRSFFAAVAGLAVLGLPGCGGTSETTGGFNRSGSELPVGQQVSGRIAPELVFSEAEIASAYGPSRVIGSAFTTSIASTTVGLLALSDSSGGVRGFALTLPGETPVFSAENSALAIIFMEPGFLRLEPTEARELIARIRSSSLFASFVQILLANAGTRRLDLLSGDANYVMAREAMVQSLGNPFLISPPTVSSNGGQVILSNPSPRFLLVVSSEAKGGGLPQSLPPYGALADVDQASTYTFQGLGPASSLPGDIGLIEQTYFPTLVFGVFIPWLELAVGQKIPVQFGLDLVQKLRAPSFEPRAALASNQSLAVVLAQDSNATVGDFADSLAGSLDRLSQFVTYDYVTGLAFSVTAIMKFKQHKDNPTQVQLGTPITMKFLAAALLGQSATLSLAG